MAKHKTKEEKIIATLRKLQNQQTTQSESSTSSSNSAVKSEQINHLPKQNYVTKFQFANTLALPDYSHVKKDILKIMILAVLAISIQVVLSLYVIH